MASRLQWIRFSFVIEYTVMIDLYTWTTPNGRKVSIMLEELGLAYRAIPVDINANEQFKPEFLAISPNNKIPAIVDTDTVIALMESAAILMYLADKTGQLAPADRAARYETLQWVMFQMGGLGPMFGQVGWFHKFAGREIEDKRPLKRYVAESKRLLGVLEKRLDGRAWIMGEEYTIADISMLGWVRNLIGFYGARDLVGFETSPLDGGNGVLDDLNRAAHVTLLGQAVGLALRLELLFAQPLKFNRLALLHLAQEVGLVLLNLPRLIGDRDRSRRGRGRVERAQRPPLRGQAGAARCTESRGPDRADGPPGASARDTRRRGRPPT